MCIAGPAEINDPLYLYRTDDGAVFLPREEFLELAGSRDNLTIMCKDSEAGILPFLVADDTIIEDIYDSDHLDEEGTAHIFPEFPLPKHFGLTCDDDLLELAPGGTNGAVILSRFHWCIFTPSEDDDAPKGAYELRFATTTKEDAMFMVETICGHCSLIAPIADVSIDIV